MIYQRIVLDKDRKPISLEWKNFEHKCYVVFFNEPLTVRRGETVPNIEEVFEYLYLTDLPQ